MGNLAIYATKGFEYLLILGFLALFTIFYLYFTSRRFENVAGVISRTLESLVDWFRVPDGILFHQGHTWVRHDAAQPHLVMVGIDDFAQKLAGPMRLTSRPAVGTFIKQGGRGWSLQSEGKTVDMLAPISGEVVEVNTALLNELDRHQQNGALLNADPYDSGWILKVKPENLERERKGLLSGSLARKWMEEVVEQLRGRMSPELGAVMQDGGEPIAGMAKNISADAWDQLLKEFFLT